MSKHKTKKLIIEDDEPKQDDLNPFSFKEFIRNKNQQPCTTEDTEVFDGVCHVEQDYNTSRDFATKGSFFTDPSVLSQPSESEHEETWIESCHPSAFEGSHDFQLCGTSDHSAYSEQSSLCSDEREANETEWELGQSDFPPKNHLGRRSTGSYEGDEETSVIDISFHSKRNNAEIGTKHAQQLREENSLLRKQIKELLRRSETDSRRIEQLTDELHNKKLQEEREAKALETMVQSVEQNLQLMTKRAVKAENTISKLKQDLNQLQGQIEGYKSENERLRNGETTALTTMRHNAQVASEYLNKAAQDAETSIKQLLTGRETLYFVSQLLTSIDKITEIHD
ncbi:endosome-associated-trafficking regulator 1 isoform X1 [Rhinichthys klamathensis goyatoka]|uniref:endosome-associated-trafficking regulator 1 isoform X1 n=1 Tax=Rhinichthys klamathensis goyatoka TaxID=3034132 RepID=UPI0024B55966|nr:endosome-associated-trafficking regulator 1 isoform X1 [Rhinichthys klamathensis goyatoka]